MVMKIGMRVLIIINCCRLLKYNYSLQRNRKGNISILLTKLNEMQKYLELGRIWEFGHFLPVEQRGLHLQGAV